MPKSPGGDHPERHRMAVLSDLLGIPHYSTSRGGTVRRDFLEAVLAGLGGHLAAKDKDSLIAVCVEVATGRPFDDRLLSTGGTVTNDALQVMIDGILRPGVEDRFRPSEVLPGDFAGQDGGAEPFRPGLVADDLRRRTGRRAVRDGQDRFRASVLEAYGSVCAVTGSDAVVALDAAHITPYLGPATSVITNGICLRADVHRLWDGGQLAVDEGDLTVVLGRALRATTYAPLHGRPLAARPRRPEQRPSVYALRAHREWCSL
jgi:putative restriction endonuclease